MPKSSKPRKQYRPRGINTSAHVVAMMGAAALHIDDRTVWSLALDSAITSVAQGEKFQAEQRIIRRMECGQMTVLEAIPLPSVSAGRPSA